MTRYCLIDVMNTVHRARHGYGKDADTDEELISGIVHIIFNSASYVYNEFDIDHLVFCFDKGSWRKSFYKEYKAHRKEKIKDDPKERRILELVYEAVYDVEKYLRENTQTTVLAESMCEADDFIARWIQLHPNDENVILSADSDFIQLIDDNVTIYNPIKKVLIHGNTEYTKASPLAKKNITMIYGQKWKEIGTVDPDWNLFNKICRGEAGDNISRSVPKGYRTAKLELIFDEPSSEMASDLFSTIREDVDGNPTVAELFERNSILINLTKQPEEIIEKMDSVIIKEAGRTKNKNAGFNFIKFCSKYNLNKLKEDATSIVPILQKGYTD